MTKIPKEMGHVIFTDMLINKDENVNTKIVTLDDTIYVKNNVSAGWMKAIFKYFDRSNGYVYATLVDDPYKTITSWNYMTVNKDYDVKMSIGLI